MSRSVQPSVSAPSDPLSERLRLAMRRFATTVSVITVSQGGQNHGVTATAVTSVCLDPPSLLVILGKETSALPPLLGARRFCINFLTAEQEALSRVFGSSKLSGQRFAPGTWSERDGYVQLVDAQASVFCELKESIPFGTHVMCLGEVRQVRVADAVNPLIYLDGRYFGARMLEKSPA
jgi:flavin reductase